MYNYSDLSDVEFEYLAHDVMEKKLGISLHRFGKGCDGGIDLTDDVKSKNIIVQVKHYIKTPFAGLLTSLKKEVPKVNKNNPKQYYVVCSCTLTPENTGLAILNWTEKIRSCYNKRERRRDHGRKTSTTNLQ